MKELKTLKELQFTAEGGCCTDCNIENIIYLKEEAIKWIKRLYEIRNHPFEQLDELEQSFMSLFVDYIGSQQSTEETINWIKYFFNITDEDLK